MTMPEFMGSMPWLSDLVIVGAGGFGRETIDVVDADQRRDATSRGGT